MSTVRSSRAERMSRIRQRIGFLCLFVMLAGSAVAPCPAEEEPPETTITRLEFCVVDAEPNAGPVQSFRYSYELHSADEEEPYQRLDVAYRSEDGILRIPKPFPTFGRIRVWIEADDLEKGYRHGFGSFSYRVDTQKPAEPTTIQLEQGIVLTGEVIDAETDKPIAGAEVAPLKWGHHFDWADWDESAKTDREGKYRIITQSAKGIGARHPGYRGIEDPHQPTLRLHPLMTLRGRVAAVDGKPIPGVSATWCDRDSDAEGHFRVKVTREEWSRRDRHKISFYSQHHRSLDVPLEDFSFDRETVVTLEREQLIRGQILDESGKPVEDCKIELKCDSEDAPPGMFCEIPGPHKQGKWKEHISEHDSVFTLRVSVAGSIRSLRQYTLEEVNRGPIITRLAQGHRLTAKLVARVPLDEKNMPVVFLSSTEDEDLEQRARVQPDGGLAFSGLADGKYALRLYPASYFQYRGGHMDGGVGGFTTFGFESPNKPWESSITIEGSDVELGPIDLHQAGVMPGRVRGVAYHPTAPHKPFANSFGYVCSGENDFDTVGGCYYLLQFMTDAQGRFQIDACPPGEYVLRLSERAGGYGFHDPSVWIRVTPEEAIDLRLLAPETDHRLVINFAVGDGSTRDVHAAAALDADAIAKHVDPKTGKLPFVDDANQRFRAKASEILCRLQPLDETTTHWPIYRERFEFGPGNLLKDNPHDIAIPNLTPGRWRLTLTAEYSSVFSISETLLTRDFAFAKGMSPLEVAIPPSALAGTCDYPARGPWDYTTTEAIPRKPGLPTRSCRGQANFRFIGLAPGEYSLRFRAEGCEPKRIDKVIVRKGQTTWLDKVTLKPATPQTETAP